MKASKRLSVGVAALSLGLLAGVVFGGGAVAKKKGKKAGRAKVTQQVGQAIPNRVPGAPWGQFRVNFNLGKKYKGLTIGDLNVTFQTIGSSATSAADEFVRVSAPNGNTDNLFDGGLGANVGPLTMDDETRTQVCNDPTPPCADPDDTLGPPYFGTARPLSPLSDLDGGKMNGTYVVSFFDTDATPATDFNIVTFVTIDVTAAVNTRKPV